MSQVLTSGFLYCGGLALADLGFRLGPAFPTILVFTLGSPLILGGIVVIFHLGSQNWLVPPFVKVLVGSIVFIPLFFVLYFPSDPPAQNTIIDTLEFLVAAYLMLPLSVLTISTYTGTLGGLILTWAIIIATGLSMVSLKPVK